MSKLWFVVLDACKCYFVVIFLVIKAADVVGDGGDTLAIR